MMRFLFSAAALLVFTPGVEAMSVPSSGLDWEKSTLTLNGFESPFLENKTIFSCFGKSMENLPIEVSLSRFGFEEQSVGPKTFRQKLAAQDCFQAAGTYRLNIKLYDGAGNLVEEDLDLVIEPGIVKADNTIIQTVDVQQYRNSNEDFIRKITSDCATENLIANGLDTCNLAVTFHDEFGNRVTSNYIEQVEVNFPGVDESEQRIKITSESSNPFHQGFRFDDGGVKRQFTGQEARIDESFLVGIKSWTPTLKMEEKTTFPFLAVETVKKPLQMEFLISELDAPTEEFNTEMEVRYRPLVQLAVDSAWSSESHFYSTLSSWSPFSVLPQFSSGKIYPERLAVIFKGKADDHSSVLFKGGGKAENSSYQASATPSDKAESMDFQFLTKSTKPDMKSVFQIFGTVGFVVRDPLFGPKLIQYPMTIMSGETLDNLISWQTLQVGADIEGKVVSKTQEVDDPSTIFLAKMQSDYREEIARNTYSLIRGIDPWNTDTVNINKDLSSPVSYIKGRNVRLTGSNDRGPMVFAGGRRTIVIEDGNLLIDRDILYGSEEDSLGIILINRTPNTRDRGNLFIHQNVKQFVGTYFLDGSILSTTIKKPEDLDMTENIRNRTLTNNQDPNAPLGFQLLLNGTVISQNTWGGANATPILDPWKKEVDFETAIRYDLDYVRRYQPTRDTDNELVSDDFNDYCVKVDGVCDVNPHAFIIRPDGRVKLHTPPGFSQLTNVSLISQ